MALSCSRFSSKISEMMRAWPWHLDGLFNQAGRGSHKLVFHLASYHVETERLDEVGPSVDLGFEIDGTRKILYREYGPSLNTPIDFNIGRYI